MTVRITFQIFLLHKVYVKNLSFDKKTCYHSIICGLSVDSYSQMGETGDEDDSDDDDGRPFSLFDGTGYCRHELSSLACQSTFANKNLRELAKMHALYRTLAGQGAHLNDREPRLQPSSLIEILSSNSRDSLLDEYRKEGDYVTLCSDTETEATDKQICNEEKSTALEIFSTIDLEYHSNLHWLTKCQEKVAMPKETSDCDKTTDKLAFVPSPVYMFPTLNDSANTSHSSLIKNRSETSVNLSDYNTLENRTADSSIDILINDRVPVNGVPVPDFVEDLEANVVLCNPVQYNYSFEKCQAELSEDHTAVCCSDNDSDCLSNVSEDSEYMIRTSKLSKFLCVGVGRTKTKTPYKVTKQNLKNESKKNSKMKEITKSKSQSKSRDSSKSPDYDSKNLLKSPSRAPLQNLSKSSSGGSSSSGSGWRSNHPVGGLKGGRMGCKSYSGGLYATTSSFSYQPSTPVEGYDSGLDSAVTPDSTTPQEVPDSWNSPSEKKSKIDNQRLQIQPCVASKSGTNSSLGTTPSLGESSGYGSMARDSECSSFSSSQDSEMDEEHKKDIGRTKSLARVPVQVEKFTEEDIQRYEGRSRTAECLHLQTEQRSEQDIAAVKARQNQLKSDLAEAKKNLSVPDKSWSYERKSNVRIPL